MLRIGPCSKRSFAPNRVAQIGSDPIYFYEYALNDEQLLYYSALPPIAKLRWLDQARRSTLLARRARESAAKEPKGPHETLSRSG